MNLITTLLAVLIVTDLNFILRAKIKTKTGQAVDQNIDATYERVAKALC